MLWTAMAAKDDSQLLLAVEPGGRTLAGLLLVRCGDRFVELYGGMAADGGPTRASYLVKWEAIRRARDEGGGSYDLWGVVNPGIAHFKAGFGGRLVEYAGAFELPLARVGAPVVRLALATRDRLRRRGGASPDPGVHP
jgi:lipid II:glycine glycyltransferase (peptidoglycan interpeptide bridge formation enzyme)